MADVADVMALFEGWLETHDGEGDLVSRVGIEAMLAAERNPILRERLAELLHEFRGVVARLVESGQARGTVPPGVSAAAVATLVAAVGDGLFLHTRLDPELDTAAAVAALRALLAS